jgi:hypothetical protein
MFDVTLTATVHEACPALIAAPATVMVPLPAAAVTPPTPLGHVDAMAGDAATTTFAGRVSVKPMPDWAGFRSRWVIVKVSVDVAARVDPGRLRRPCVRAGVGRAVTVSVELAPEVVIPAAPVMLPAPGVVVRAHGGRADVHGEMVARRLPRIHRGAVTAIVPPPAAADMTPAPLGHVEAGEGVASDHQVGRQRIGEG